MPKRTIAVVYYTTLDGEVHQRGEKVDMSTEEAERGDALNAFEGAKHQPDLVVPAEMSHDQIDALSGADLDTTVEMAGIDASTGGSLASGQMSADEKRDALKASNG